MRLRTFLADHQHPGSLAHRFRRRRFAAFAALLTEVPGARLLVDVGGTVAFWTDDRLAAVPAGCTVVVVNTEDAGRATGRVQVMRADARALPFADGAADVVFSNSVIEHVGDAGDQRRMAEEIRRVGRRYFVQTPNHWFPLEPHFLVPGLQWLPLPLRARLIAALRPGFYGAQVRSLAEARAVAASIRLLRRREVEALFPGAAIHVERAAGLAKSFVAIGRGRG